MEEDELSGSEKRSRSPTDLPAGPAKTKTGATPPPGGFHPGESSQADGERSEAGTTAQMLQDLVQAAVPKLKTLARSSSNDTLALNGEARRPSIRSEEYWQYSSDDSYPSEASSWLSEDSTAPSQHAGAHQTYFFEYGSAAHAVSPDSSPSPRSSPEKSANGDGSRQERRKAKKDKRGEGGGAAAVQGRGLCLDLCTGSSLMVLEDAPAITAASSALHEREPRFVRRCGHACRHYAMWRMKKENAVLALGASLLRKSIEAIVSVAPLVLAALLLLYCFSLEEPDTWDREIVSIPLLNAAESGDVQQVELLLNNGANIEQRNYYGLTALHRASEEGKVPVVKLLLSRGADVLTLDCDGQSALEKAAQQGHKRTVGLLARWGGDVHFRDSMGYNLVMRAAEWGWHHVVVTLLQSSQGLKELDSKDLFDETPLLKAARNGRKQVVSTLLKHGAAVTATDKEENTVLLWAVRHEWKDLIPLLLNAATFPQHELNRGLAVAVKRGLTGVVALLLRSGADAGVRDGHGHTLVMKAAQGGHEAVARALLKHTGLALVDAVNARGQTALMLAAEREGTVAAAKVLLARRASVNVQDRQGETALFKAVAHANAPLVRLLLAKGALAALPDKHGTLPLRRAAMEGQRELVSVLVSRQPRLSAWELLGELAAAPEEAEHLRRRFTAASPDRPHPPALETGSLLAWIHRDEEEMLEVWEEGGAGEWGHCDGDGECGPEGLETEEGAEGERKGLWARLAAPLSRWRQGPPAPPLARPLRPWSEVGEEERWESEGQQGGRESGVKGGATHAVLALGLPAPPAAPGQRPKGWWGAVGAWVRARAARKAGQGQPQAEQAGAEGGRGAGEGMRSGAGEGWTVLGLRVLGRAAAAALALLHDAVSALASAAQRALGGREEGGGGVRGGRKRDMMEQKPWTAAGAPEMGPWWRWRGGGMGLVKRWLREGHRPLPSPPTARADRAEGSGRSEVVRQEMPRHGWRERVAGWTAGLGWMREALMAGSEQAKLPGRRRASSKAREQAGREEEEEEVAGELRLRMPSETACLVERVLLPWLPFQPSSQLCTLRHHLIDYILEYGEQLHRVEMEQLGIGGEDAEGEEGEEELSVEVEQGGGYEGGGLLFGEDEPRDEGWAEEGEAEPGAIPYAVYLD